MFNKKKYGYSTDMPLRILIVQLNRYGMDSY